MATEPYLQTTDEHFAAALLPVELSPDEAKHNPKHFAKQTTDADAVTALHGLGTLAEIAENCEAIALHASGCDLNKSKRVGDTRLELVTPSLSS